MKKRTKKQDITRFKFKAGLPLEFEIAPIRAFMTKNRDVLIQPHRTDFYHILWIEKGSATHLVDFKPIPVKRDSILFIGKGKVHFFDPAQTYDGILMLFTDNFFCRNPDDSSFLESNILFNDLLETTPLKLGKEIKSYLAGIFQLMARESNALANSAILKNYLHNFLLVCEREKRNRGFQEIPKGPDRDYSILYVSMVNQHFVTVKSVSAYADMIHISEKRLSRAVANVFGKTPKEIINDRVLLECRRFLVHTNQNIKEIGFSLGFAEPTNFIKYFKQQTGQTPSEFRESHLG